MNCHVHNLILTLSLIINAYAFLIYIFCREKDYGRRFGEERRKNQIDVRK